MGKIKELTVFTVGNSSKISTWSNVPFFFTETLIQKNIKVNRVDLEPSPLVKKIYNNTVYRILKMKNKTSTHNYFRSLIHFIHTQFRIKKAIKFYSDSDANIFLTFSFSSVGRTKKPTIQFSDWTYDHYFKYFLNRKPGLLEKQSIKRENRRIEKSDLVFSLFPGVVENMRKFYRNENIYYMGNVINSLYDSSESEMVNYKKSSNNILFVGGLKYIAGARSLIVAFEELKQNYPDLSLHIIGINASSFENIPKDVHCYGYLDKGNTIQRELYYKLFKEAKVFINTTPKWGAFSATIEAMYFYIPVIISPYDEFVKTFGENIDFGYYCDQNIPDLIKDKIATVLNSASFTSLCSKAHNAVKDYTWSAYVDQFLERIKEKLITSH